MNKHCNKCNETKDLEEFCKSKRHKDGRHIYCKVCRRGEWKTWKDKNKDKVKKHQTKFLQQNPDYEKDYYYKNKDNRSEKYQYHDPVIYYRLKENYVGVTKNVTRRNNRYRSENKPHELTILTKLKHTEDAYIVESILQKDFGFNGFYQGTYGYYNKSQNKHFRLANILNKKIENDAKSGELRDFNE